jgi:hypothetical protein
MEKLRRDLKAVSKRLSNLVRQLEKIIIKVDEQIQFYKIPKVKSTRKKAVKTVPEKKAVVRKTAPPTAVDTIYSIIRKSKRGINTSELMEKTGYERKSVSNAIYKLTKQGKIKTVAKGVYVKS